MSMYYLFINFSIINHLTKTTNSYTSFIILYLLKNVNKLGFNINYISRENKISVGSAFKILKDLEKDKLVKKTIISNASHYNLNYANPETIKLCEFLLLAEKRGLKGRVKVYSDELAKYRDANMILLFGSILKGKEFNDVDVLFLTDEVKKVNDFCLEISKIRTKPVVPLILDKEDLINGLKNKDQKLLNIIKDCVVLQDETTFLEVIKNVHSEEKT